MSIASKLQVKPQHAVVVLRRPKEVDLDLATDDIDAADAAAVVLFVHRADDLESPDGHAVIEAARRDALAWVAYPKAGKLGTDLNRDSLAARMRERGVRPVRQISVDRTWSALRFRSGG